MQNLQALKMLHSYILNIEKNGKSEMSIAFIVTYLRWTLLCNLTDYVY